MSSDPTVSPARMSAEDRREMVLEAATSAFAAGGYAGTSTDAVAKVAGVSQPYVVRIFGTKRELFLAVFERATTRIRRAFESVIAEGPFDADDDADWHRLGVTYTELLADRDLLMVMMHGFAAGDDDEIAALGREAMGAIFATLTATGAADERVCDFIAHGMLLNVMVSMHAPEHVGADDALAPLTTYAFAEALPLLTATLPGRR